MEKEMNATNQTTAQGRRGLGVACLAGFFATMLALPASAQIEIPDDPLTTGARVAPNILFILDDSGSMAFDYMPDDAPSGFRRQSYASNTLYYDPSKTYEPWMGADGNRLTGGTSFNAVYGSFNRVGGNTIDLRNSDSCRRYNNNTDATNDEFSSGATQVCGGLNTTTFYVPKTAANAGSSSQGDYYRFQIHSDGAVIRSDWGARSGSSPNYNRGLNNRGCSTSTGSQWRNCTQVLPASSPRTTEAQERANFATWFSYHRTRMKAAKAGASEAFAQLDGNVRVGFRTIHNRNPFNIPVGDGNDGRFVDNDDDPQTPGNESTTSRSTWYARLRAPIGYSGTPLLSALTGAGEYFSQSAASGPYGPESGANQLTCRQNFSILTTDGYWNSESVSLGNVDGTNGATIEGPNNQSYRYTAAAPFRDGYSNTLADVAMHYWKRDLRTEAHMTNNVPSSTANPAFWQHMVTFGISIGFTTSRGWSSVSDVPANPNWPDPQVSNTSGSASIPARIDDLLHAAVNGRGEFVAASDPAEFANGLAAALATISERTSSASNVAANSVSLDTDSKVFNASYVSGLWTGTLTAREVDADGLGSVLWNASIPAWNTRRVFTSSGSVGATFPTASQTSSLARGGGPANYEVTGTDNANYLKGERRLEANRDGTLRVRTSILGDIINSSPAYVADTETIYVGANDGMLHAFNAANGQELFAFVPSILDFNALASLSKGDYNHRYFVDGPVVVSSRSLTPGKNILVGTLGRGGTGIYALDVSSPSTFGASSFKWDMKETDGENMGKVLGKPLITKVAGKANPVVVIGNGVNSKNHKAVLIIVDAETGAVVREIGTDGSGTAAQPNGLFTPTGVYGSDGRTLAYVYAGDMLGNVWKFDLTNPVSSTWSAQRIFTAVDGDDNRQPITAGVAVSTHPVTNKRWIFFGTGRFLTNEDASIDNTDVQSMYGFIDDGVPVSRGELTRRTVDIGSATVNGYPVRGFEARDALPEGSRGWYLDLPERGERIVQDAQVVSTFLVTASMIPSGSACDADGTGYINALDAFTGTSAGGSYFDLDGDGSTNDDAIGDRPVGSVNLGVGMPTLPSLLRRLLVTGGSGGSGLGGANTLAPRWDRASWREIRGD